MLISVYKPLTLTGHLLLKFYFAFIKILYFFKRGEKYIHLSASPPNSYFEYADHTFIFQVHYCHDSFKDHKLKKSCVSEFAEWMIVIDSIQKDNILILTLNCDCTESFFCRESDMALRSIVIEKLLDILLKRYIAFNGTDDGGVLIFLAKGLTGYAQTLEALLLELSHINGLEPEFLDWIENANYFCDCYE